MLAGAQLKEHVLNRIGYGQGVWASARYDSLGSSGFIAEQLDGSLQPISQTGTTIFTKIDRSVTSRRQLEVTLLDFWFNHFNVDTRGISIDIVEDTITGRMVGHHQNIALLPNLLGDFQTMLIETARSPSMLDYLDNRINYKVFVGSDGRQYGGNDNYAREVMELHTIGVNGGYTELDVSEAARILTGWSVSEDAYAWKNWAHDFDPKTVMGDFYPAGIGEEEGELFLTRLANHPSAAEFLTRKLVARYVDESVPAGVHGAAEAVYLPTRDLRQVMTTIFGHADFTADTNFRSKVKPPHRFAISGLMAMGATAEADWLDIRDAVQTGILDAGDVPYVVPPPTGYPERSDFWISGSAMLARFELAELIAYHPPLLGLLKTRSGADGVDPIATVDAVADVLVPGGLSDSSRVASLDHVAANGVTNDGRVSAAAHVIMCSPEFVRY